MTNTKTPEQPLESPHSINEPKTAAETDAAVKAFEEANEATKKGPQAPQPKPALKHDEKPGSRR